MALVSYRNISGLAINDCLATGSLKSVQDGQAANFRPDSISHLSVNNNIIFPDSNQQVYMVQSFQLSQAAQLVTHANCALVTLSTYAGDDPLTMTQA